MADPPTRYPEVTVGGPPRELGRQIGESLREAIRGFTAIALERANKTVRISRDRAIAIAQASADFAAAYSPELIDELHGIAEASGVSFEELMMLQVRNQLTSSSDAGCTALAVAGGRAATRNLVGQNWDNDPALDAFTVVLTRRPRGKPALVNITQAGLIGYIGMNDEGIGLCLNSLSAPGRGAGVPLYFIVRQIFAALSLDEATETVRRADRAIPANVMLATPQGPADLEMTLDAVHVIRDDGSGVVAHANHCVHPKLRSIADKYPELIQSFRRQARIERLLDIEQRPIELERFKAMLRDHENHPRSICRHANDDPTTGFWETVFSVIIDPQAAELHLTRGVPCEHPYEVYRLQG